VSGRGGGCRPKRNGRKPHAGRMDGPTRGEMGVQYKALPIMAVIWETRQLLEAILREPARMVPWIWLAMCGNGCRTGTVRAITGLVPPATPRVRILGIIVSCGAGLGPAPRTISALPSGTGSILRSLATVSVSGVPLVHPRRGQAKLVLIFCFLHF
jgi:hypothetical protein